MGKSCTRSPPSGKVTDGIEAARPGPTGTGSRDSMDPWAALDGGNDTDRAGRVSTPRNSMATGRLGRAMGAMVLAGAHLRISCARTQPSPARVPLIGPASVAVQPSYSNPILSSTRYSTISPSATLAVDFTTSIVRMLRTVLE